MRLRKSNCLSQCHFSVILELEGSLTISEPTWRHHKLQAAQAFASHSWWNSQQTVVVCTGSEYQRGAKDPYPL